MLCLFLRNSICIILKMNFRLFLFFINRNAKETLRIPARILTEIGKKFRPVIDALQNWGYEYIEYLQKDKE